MTSTLVIAVICDIRSSELWLLKKTETDEDILRWKTVVKGRRAGADMYIFVTICLPIVEHFAALPFADSRYFHNETRCGGYLGHGWEEGIGAKELWLWLPENQDWTATWRSWGTSTGAPPPRESTAAAPQRGSGWRQSRAPIPFSSMSRLNLDFRESKPKFLSPNSF